MPIYFLVLPPQLITMRSPIGKFGPLKNNWRETVNDWTFQRKSQTNTGLAGTPAFNISGDENRTPRRDRIWRWDLRQYIIEEIYNKELECRSARKTMENVQKDVNLLQAIADVSVGTLGEAEALAELESAQFNLGMATMAFTNCDDELYEARMDAYDRKEAVGAIARARYEAGFQQHSR